MIRYIPQYTPEMNPAGMLWRVIKKAAANVLYGSADAMRSVRRMLRTRELGVAEMNHYLLG